jgi:hypothetical protein
MWGPREAGASGGSHKKARTRRADDADSIRSSVPGEVTRGVSSLMHDASAVAFAESAAQHIVIAVENQPTR